MSVTPDITVFGGTGLVEADDNGRPRVGTGNAVIADEVFLGGEHQVDIHRPVVVHRVGVRNVVCRSCGQDNHLQSG